MWLDIDDTLVDFQANSLNALRLVYDQFNLSRFFNERQQWIDLYHAHNQSLWIDYNNGHITQSYLRMERFRRPLAQAGCPDDTARVLSDMLDPVYLDLLGRGKITIPGAHELLTHLRVRGYGIGVLSNGFQGVQQLKLKSTGLDAMIDLVVLSDDIGINKPDVRLYRHAQLLSGCNTPSRHLMIGDNPDTDIAGALNAGWQGVLFNPHGVPECPGCMEVSSLIECVRLL